MIVLIFSLLIELSLFCFASVFSLFHSLILNFQLSDFVLVVLFVIDCYVIFKFSTVDMLFWDTEFVFELFLLVGVWLDMLFALFLSGQITTLLMFFLLCQDLLFWLQLAGVVLLSSIYFDCCISCRLMGYCHSNCHFPQASALFRCWFFFLDVLIVTIDNWQLTIDNWQLTICEFELLLL